MLRPIVLLLSLILFSCQSEEISLDRPIYQDEYNIKFLGETASCCATESALPRHHVVNDNYILFYDHIDEHMVLFDKLANRFQWEMKIKPSLKPIILEPYIFYIDHERNKVVVLDLNTGTELYTIELKNALRGLLIEPYLADNNHIFYVDHEYDYLNEDEIKVEFIEFDLLSSTEINRYSYTMSADDFSISNLFYPPTFHKANISIDSRNNINLLLSEVERNEEQQFKYTYNLHQFNTISGNHNTVELEEIHEAGKTIFQHSYNDMSIIYELNNELVRFNLDSQEETWRASANRNFRIKSFRTSDNFVVAAQILELFVIDYQSGEEITNIEFGSFAPIYLSGVNETHEYYIQEGYSDEQNQNELCFFDLTTKQKLICTEVDSKVNRIFVDEEKNQIYVVKQNKIHTFQVPDFR